MEAYDRKLADLISLAIELGASDAAVITTDKIDIRENLAALCTKPRCQNYGLSPGCPPHVPGPEGFRNLQKICRYAVVVRIDVAVEILLSSRNRDIMRLLHQIVAGIEKQAIGDGYRLSRAFAGGSCKSIFCTDNADCRVLSEKGECRYPEYARPSMSGFGIDVGALMQAAGWCSKKMITSENSDAKADSWVAGMVMIG